MSISSNGRGANKTERPAGAQERRRSPHDPSRRRAVPLARLLGATALLVGPTVLALDLFVFVGDIDPILALWVVLVGALAAAAVVLYFYRDISRVMRYAARLGRLTISGRRPAPPRPASSMLRDLVAALARLDRRWRGRFAILEQRRQIDEHVINALHDPLIVIDRVGLTGRYNQAAKAVIPGLGYGQAFFEQLGGDALREAAATALATRKAQEVELAITVNGQPKTYSVRVAPFSIEPLDPDAMDIEIDEPVDAPSLLVTLHDITELRRAEQMREDFVANISHELQTPLSTFIGFIETIRGPARDDPEAQQRFLGIMHEQASHMSRLVRELLMLSKIENAEQPPPQGRVNLRGVLDQVTERLALKASSRAIRVRVDVPTDLPALQADRDQIIQLFQNLIDNAIKYSRSGAAVHVSAEPVFAQARPMVRIRVRDQGQGIAPEHIPLITERFYRIPTHSRDAGTAESKTGGVGLGLAIVKHIVSRHSGSLDIASEPGRGSTFTVTLPAAPREELEVDAA